LVPTIASFTAHGDWIGVMTWSQIAPYYGVVLFTTFWTLSFVLTFMGIEAIGKRRVQLTGKRTWTGGKAVAVGFFAVAIGLAIIVLGLQVPFAVLSDATDPLLAAACGVLWILGVAVTIIGFMVVVEKRIQLTKIRLLTGQNAVAVGAIISMIGLMMTVSAQSILLHSS
jgi:hypothetical protein